MPEVYYRNAEPFELELLDGVRSQYHRHLDGYDIGLIFRNRGRKRNGLRIIAQAVKPALDVQFLTGYDAWIEVADPMWDRYGSNIAGWREYILDHELSHFWEARGGLIIIGHPFEDFPVVLGRHDPEITGFAKVLRTVEMANGSAK